MKEVLNKPPSQKEYQGEQRYTKDEDHYFLDHHDEQLKKYYYYGMPR
jgi:hypothetical protein